MFWSSESPLKTHHLISGAQFSTAGVDFIQVTLDGLQVGDAIAPTQLQNQLQQGKGNSKEHDRVGKTLISIMRKVNSMLKCT